MATFDKLQSVKALKDYYDAAIRKTHLKDLLKDKERNSYLFLNHEEGKLFLDCTHTKIDGEALELLAKVAIESQVYQKVQQMLKGEKINNTEGRSVLHVALRKPKEESLIVDGKDVVKDVHEVLSRIEDFSNKVRTGQF